MKKNVILIVVICLMMGMISGCTLGRTAQVDVGSVTTEEQAFICANCGGTEAEKAEAEKVEAELDPVGIYHVEVAGEMCAYYINGDGTYTCYSFSVLEDKRYDPEVGRWRKEGNKIYCTDKFGSTELTLVPNGLLFEAWYLKKIG